MVGKADTQQAICSSSLSRGILLSVKTQAVREIGSAGEALALHSTTGKQNIHLGGSCQLVTEPFSPCSLAERLAYRRHLAPMFCKPDVACY
mmetsp:Transcript_85054/g.214320  ORF Transcript_85054/g.214320 Transcript_85054/m.214320 type:complete len:91 (-) Transcript_85054:14-286(-)